MSLLLTEQESTTIKVLTTGFKVLKGKHTQNSYIQHCKGPTWGMTAWNSYDIHKQMYDKHKNEMKN